MAEHEQKDEKNDREKVQEKDRESPVAATSDAEPTAGATDRTTPETTPDISADTSTDTSMETGMTPNITAQPAILPERPAAASRRGPDVLTLFVGLICLIAATMAFTNWTPSLPGLDPRLLLAGGAVLVGLLLLAASLRSPGRSKRSRG